MTDVDVLFVCLHGSAKSVIAMHHLRRLATARGLDVTSGSAGVDPDETIAPHVVEGLRADGFDVTGIAPRPVSRELVGGARHVVSFGCDLAEAGSKGNTVTLWHDVPAVSDGYAEARDEIVRRLPALLDGISGASRRP